MSEAIHHRSLVPGLSPDSATALTRGARRRSFQRGAVVFHKGDPGTSMYVILKGQVKIVLPRDDGEEMILGVLNEGDCFGELALLDSEPRSATIVATEPTNALLILREDFLRAISQNSRVALDLLEVLTRRLRETDEVLEDAALLDVPGRLAKRLLELAEEYGTLGPEGTVLGIRLTQSDLAAMIGATRESVNKHLGAFRARGVIAMQGPRIVIREPSALRRRIS